MTDDLVGRQTDAEVAAIAAGLTAAQGYALLRLPGGEYMTCAESGVSGMAATLLCTRTPPLTERRWTRWGSEPGQKRGEGYEYRCLPLGLLVAQHLKQENAK